MTYVFILLRQYNVPTPTIPMPNGDMWFKVPVLDFGGIISFTHTNLELAAIMIVDAQGRVIKTQRTNTNTAKVSEYLLTKLGNEAFDIEAWEAANGTAFPYESMFDRDAVRQRLLSVGKLEAGTISNNVTFKEIRSEIKPKCKQCGQRNA